MLKVAQLSTLLLLSGLAVFSLLSFGRLSEKSNRMIIKSPLVENSDSETFQELGFFGPVKKDKWGEFLWSVQTNIINSRDEPGNITFALYQLETGELQPIWFERFKNKKAHAFHKEQSYFKAAIQVIQQSLENDARSIELKTIN